MKKIEAKKISERYLLVSGKHKVGVEKDLRQNKLSVYRYEHFNEPLIFKNSTPEMVETMGKFLIKASKL